MKITEPIAAAIPIFESTGQAIHVAFTILAEPAQQDSMLRKSIISALESMPLLSGRQQAFLDQLRGTPSETVHFDGLASNDVRAQCALVMSAVRTKLPDPERWAIFAKYAKTDFEDVGEDRSLVPSPGRGNGEPPKRRFAFSPEKIEAVQNLSMWAYNGMSERGPVPVPLLAVDCMVAKIYAHHRNTQISFRSLAHAFGGNHMTYARLLPKIRKRLAPLESMAISRLTPYFEQQGIVMRQTLK